MWDGFGVLNQDPRFYQFPALEHLHVRKFPTLRSGFFTLNIRRTGQDHRKILVVDGEVGFVGGYNIGDPFANEWRDTPRAYHGRGRVGAGERLRRLLEPFPSCGRAGSARVRGRARGART